MNQSEINGPNSVQISKFLKCPNHPDDLVCIFNIGKKQSLEDRVLCVNCDISNKSLINFQKAEQALIKAYHNEIEVIKQAEEAFNKLIDQLQEQIQVLIKKFQSLITKLKQESEIDKYYNMFSNGSQECQSIEQIQLFSEYLSQAYEGNMIKSKLHSLEKQQNLIKNLYDKSVIQSSRYRKWIFDMFHHQSSQQHHHLDEPEIPITVILQELSEVNCTHHYKKVSRSQTLSELYSDIRTNKEQNDQIITFVDGVICPKMSYQLADFPKNQQSEIRFVILPLQQ